jgi:hypothetical protein
MNEPTPSIERSGHSRPLGRRALAGFTGLRLVSFDPVRFNGDTEEILAFPTISEREETVVYGPYPWLIRPDRV